MTKEEYIKRKISAGHILHLHDGIWWETIKSGYCKPAILFDEVAPGSARPALPKSYIGYNHRISNATKATGVWEPFLMTKDKLTNWDIKNLKNKGRKSSIKKGLKLNKIIKVNDIGQYRDSISELLKSVAVRIQHGHTPDYYDLDKNEWWSTLERVANYTEFWCAFDQGNLTGYICIHVMGSRVVIDGVKVHSEWLNASVIDSLLYTIILDLKSRGNVNEIWYGGKSNRPTLDKFKTSYGFEVVKVPYQIKLFGGLLKYPRFINNWRNTSDT